MKVRISGCDLVGPTKKCASGSMGWMWCALDSAVVLADFEVREEDVRVIYERS